MYEYIKGILTKITAKYIVVETADRYLLHVANPYAYSGKSESRGKSICTKWSVKTLTFSMALRQRKRNSSFKLDLSLWDWTYQL